MRDGNVYARGATDDKGQMLTHVKSAEAWIKTAGKLPLQVKFLIEGEEEVGSEHLEPFVAANREKLACDAVVISDSSQFAPGVPAITYGLRGIAYYELRLTRPEAGPALRHVRRRASRIRPTRWSTMLAALDRRQTAASRCPASTTTSSPLTDREREAVRALPLPTKPSS